MPVWFELLITPSVTSFVICRPQILALLLLSLMPVLLGSYKSQSYRLAFSRPPVRANTDSRDPRCDAGLDLLDHSIELID
jgi:hypothetical protein